MTNLIGIHSARVLAGIGIAPVNAMHILMSELQLTTPQADAAVAEAYRREAHPAEVGGASGHDQAGLRPRRSASTEAATTSGAAEVSTTDAPGQSTNRAPIFLARSPDTSDASFPTNARAEARAAATVGATEQRKEITSLDVDAPHLAAFARSTGSPHDASSTTLTPRRRCSAARRRDTGQLLANFVAVEHRPAELVCNRTRQRCLARTRRSPHENEPHPARRQVRFGECKQVARAVRSLRRAILGPQAGHLGPHECAIRDVEMLERFRPCVAGALSIPVEKVMCEIRASESFEVHREERDIGENVAVPQMVVELEAVEHARRVSQAEDVVGEQVTVPVAGASGRDALVEELDTTRDVGTSERSEPVDIVTIENRRHVRCELGEVVFPPTCDGVVHGVRVDRAARRRAVVEPRDDVGHPIQARGRVGGARHERGQAAIIGHAHHLDEVVDHSSRRIVEGNDPEVDVSRQPPIEPDFTLALASPQLSGRQVDKWIDNRLLQLPGAIAGERKDRDVSLSEADLATGSASLHPSSQCRALTVDSGVRRRHVSP